MLQFKLTSNSGRKTRFWTGQQTETIHAREKSVLIFILLGITLFYFLLFYFLCWLRYTPMRKYAMLELFCEKAFIWVSCQGVSRQMSVAYLFISMYWGVVLAALLNFLYFRTLKVMVSRAWISLRSLSTLMTNKMLQLLACIGPSWRFLPVFLHFLMRNWLHARQEPTSSSKRLGSQWSSLGSLCSSHVPSIFARFPSLIPLLQPLYRRSSLELYCRYVFSYLFSYRYRSLSEKGTRQTRNSVWTLVPWSTSNWAILILWQTLKSMLFVATPWPSARYLEVASQLRFELGLRPVRLRSRLVMG